eukprot:CAMPEP_0116878082 /NCGR_PEP_ID=MMETSP0463-20121206/9821_1 /TAXON_ID=181622 /ORGANISM="Strombidinopsis sp, Strain SopsisLIS2011" /LENGTH=157 /DNA_ID=CAMNT_0004525925 /DNA_START=5059 /DNA_END=5532 /DNA_ORIENTATION=-
MTLVAQVDKGPPGLKNATDVTRLVTLQENVLMLPKVVIIEQAKATKDNVVMMEALLIEKDLMTMVLVLKVAGEAATTQDKAGTTTWLTILCKFLVLTMRQVVVGTLLKMLILVLIPVGQVELSKTNKFKMIMAGKLTTPRTTKNPHQMDGVNERIPK